MATTRFDMSDTTRISQIPVMTPRAPPHHILSLSSPLGLVPPARYPSVSGSPTLPSPSSASGPASPSSGGSTPFRSFRNFLSFGSSKTAPSTSAPPPVIPKNHFGTLGPIRRSVNVERRASSPQLNTRRSEDDYVLSIDLPRPGDERSLNTHSNKSGGSSIPLSLAPQRFSSSPLAESPASPDTPALPATELSTIIESETSGISKHLPSLDTSQASDGDENEQESFQSPRAFLPQALHPLPRDTRHGSSSPSNDTPALNLSTSKLTSEVLAALSESPVKENWLHAVVVEDAPSDSAISREQTFESPDTSFNLSSLDPDLAALLSPNRMRGSAEPALLVAIDAIPPPTSSPPTMKPSSIAATPITPTSQSFASISARRAPPPSLSAAPRLPTAPTFIPRITRSVSDRPTASVGSSSPIERSTSVRTMSGSPERASMSTSISHNRLQRATAADFHSSIRRPSSSGNVEQRRTAVTPACPSSSAFASSSRPPLSRLHSTRTSAREVETASPSSRAPSSQGTASSRLQNHRPSLDMERPRFTGNMRSRKRSTSVIENRVTGASPQPPAMPLSRSMADWLGPRTQKAFAAAGLLDFEKESPGSASRPPSRFGTTRSSIDRDSRSRGAPSRMALSEAGSSSSWGLRSGSVSRAAGYADTVGLLSETMSTPRTTFSSASTAPTSVSAASSMQQHMQTEVQQLQEKHALETSALLNALADSQRTTRMLREENGQLRDRMEMLEDKLADAQERIQQIIRAQPPAKSMYSKRYGSPASSEHRSISHSRNNSFLRARADASPYADLLSSPEPPCASPETPLDNAEAFIPPIRKRISTASSVFATLPSNMSMIMHEEGVSPDAFPTRSLHSSSPPGSPTMVFGRLQSPGGGMYRRPPSRGGHSHRATRSVSSAGNISPTTASFSMITGSPGSLNLRPEHELHLGDMAPLDLDGDDFEFGSHALR